MQSEADVGAIKGYQCRHGLPRRVENVEEPRYRMGEARGVTPVTTAAFGLCIAELHVDAAASNCVALVAAKIYVPRHSVM